jgi:AcrR family transcriptional regulator
MVRMIVRMDTKTKILDIAEKLFGQNGFEATSLRDITTGADVNLAAVNYHFQSKDSLIDAVIARRIEPVNRRRLEMLEAAGPSPTVEQVVEAFARPVIETDATPIIPLMGRVLSTHDQFIVRVFKKHLVVVAQTFDAALAKALPHLSAAERKWRLHFMAGAMAHVLSWGHLLPETSDGICDPSDRRAVTERLVRFVAAGFRAPEVN